MARLSGKLTARSLGWDRGRLATKTQHTTNRIKLGRIVGIVNGLHETFDDEKGTVQVGLKGEFRGISTVNVEVDSGQKDSDGAPIMTDTGKPIEVTAGRCYLPSGLQDMIESAYAIATKDDPKANVTFALDLFAMKANNKAGYSFDAETLVEAQADDPLATLLAQAETAALPAPTEDVTHVKTDKEPAKEPTKK